MKTYITSKSGTRLEINRCATAKNPDWVYRQTGTSGQAELNGMLSAYHLSDFYYRGKHLGPDFLGIELFDEESLGDRLACTLTDDELVNSRLSDLCREAGYPSLRTILNDFNWWDLSLAEVESRLSHNFSTVEDGK